MESSQKFSDKRLDIQCLYSWYFYLLSEVEKIEKLFHTQKGMTSELENRNTYPNDFTKEEIESERKKEYDDLSCSIYNSLELLYRLKRASNSLRTYLYSPRVERLILKALNKDK